MLSDAAALGVSLVRGAELQAANAAMARMARALTRRTYTLGAPSVTSPPCHGPAGPHGPGLSAVVGEVCASSHSTPLHPRPLRPSAVKNGLVLTNFNRPCLTLPRHQTFLRVTL